MERSPLARPYRQWVASPNHQVAGSDVRALAERDRPLLARNRAGLVAEMPQPHLMPMERVAQMIGRFTGAVPPVR